jgi:hypothetical protein
MFTGCVTQAVNKETINVAATVADLQQQEVLDNIARFEANANALPSMVQIQSGIIQVADTINPTGKLTYQKIVPTIEGDLGITRQWTANWTVNPVTDPSDLRRLRILFRNVTGFYSDENTLRADWRNVDRGPMVTQIKDTTSSTQPGTSTIETTKQVNPSLGDAPVLVKRDNRWYSTTQPTSGPGYLCGRFEGTVIYVLKDSQRIEKLSELVLFTMKATPATKQSGMFQLQLHQPLINP